MESDFLFLVAGAAVGVYYKLVVSRLTQGKKPWQLGRWSAQDLLFALLSILASAFGVARASAGATEFFKYFFFSFCVAYTIQDILVTSAYVTLGKSAEPSAR